MVRFRKITLRVRRVSTCGLVVAVASCGGGGDDGGTTSPGTVARVEITSPSNRLEVGQNMQVTVRYFDASSSQLTGRTISVFDEQLVPRDGEPGRSRDRDGCG